MAFSDAFQRTAFQAGAFQFSTGIPITPRGFEETLAAFALQRRKEREEREVTQLVALESDIIIRHIKPFLGRRDS